MIMKLIVELGCGCNQPVPPPPPPPPVGGQQPPAQPEQG
jgi:hypothetical protein